MQTRKGQSIEDASMAIIDDEIGSHPYSQEEWPIVRRIIHSTADFDFAREGGILFHESAIHNGMESLKNGCNIICDVNGVLGLLNKQNLAEFGNDAFCRISDPAVVKIAHEQNITRAKASMRYSVNEMDNAVVVIGNAPTALLELISMMRDDLTHPSLVVGLPVGFIQAAESKAELAALSGAAPYVTNRGRKGGSAAAAAVINALFKIIRSSS